MIQSWAMTHASVIWFGSGISWATRITGIAVYACSDAQKHF